MTGTQQVLSVIPVRGHAGLQNAEIFGVAIFYETRRGPTRDALGKLARSQGIWQL
jgi:hypothetical protein